MFVMGTAGHVDHGKSTLVKALTGIDPDRLPEEKERGLTIDLGFAWLKTSSGETIGIVDVPGHERFVKNMIAGVGAIDFVLLVIAADDGWMPQSAEHLAILEFLGVTRGIVVITKCDTVDAEWLKLVQSDVPEKLSKSTLRDAKILPVDSLSGRGLDDLRNAIDDIVRTLEPPHDIGKPRLYIDRVFSMAGRGVVVTGTLTGGTLQTGDSVAIVPGKSAARVRDLQNHGTTVETAHPGQRIAINLAGVELANVHRGQCVVDAGNRATTDRLWVHLHLWREAARPLKAQRQVLVMTGTAEPEGIAYPVDTELIEPDSDGLCELRLHSPIPARISDRFVLRWPTPQVTIGGGQILDLGGTRRLHRDKRFIDGLWSRARGGLDEHVISELNKSGLASRRSLLSESRWSRAAIDIAVNSAIEAKTVIDHGDSLFHSAWCEQWLKSLHSVLSAYHNYHPYAVGLNLSEWRDRARVPEAAAPAMIEALTAQGVIGRSGEFYHLHAHAPTIPSDWTDEEHRLWTVLTNGGMQPPVRTELEAVSPHAKSIIQFWLATQRIVNLTDGVIFPSDVFDKARRRIIEALRTGGSLTASGLRDLLGTTRKYAVPIGEQLDREGLTRREGDQRVLVEG